MLTFTLLVLTGLPQRFTEEGWARLFVTGFGGIGAMRWIHRAFGLTFTLLVFLALRARPWSPSSSAGRPVDGAHPEGHGRRGGGLKEQLGMSGERARYDRFDYKQKFEYWGLVLGGMVMITTGFVLLVPSLATHVLPGELVPMSKVAHGNEAMMPSWSSSSGTSTTPTWRRRSSPTTAACSTG